MEPLYSIAQRGFKSPFPHHLYLMYLQQKATHLLGGFLRSLGGRRGSDFCEKLTFYEIFSQKNFFKKFSNFPENRLTPARKCGIIEEKQGGRPMTYEQKRDIMMMLYLYKKDSLTFDQCLKIIEKTFEKDEKTLDKSKQM